MTTTIYTVGYGSSQPQRIVDLLDRYGAVLVDIRYSPWGRPGWKRHELAALLGDRYIHLQALGNADYKSGGMRITDYAAGKAFLTDLPQPAMLMCACWEPEGCHRTVVGRMLTDDGFTVVELNESQPRHQQMTLWSEP